MDKIIKEVLEIPDVRREDYERQSFKIAAASFLAKGQRKFRLKTAFPIIQSENQGESFYRPQPIDGRCWSW